MKRAARLVLKVAIGFVACCMLSTACPLQRVRETPGWYTSTYCIRNIGEAIRYYHDTFKCLPPPAVYSKNGKPLLSWRVLLLPFLEESELYRQFKLDEPWDSPHNKPLLETVPGCYCMHGIVRPPLTHYRAFVGPGTAFERDGLTWRDFPDGLENTILIVEASEPIPWTKPDELVYDPAKPLPSLGGHDTKPFYFLRFETSRKPGFSAVFADGTARFITSQPDEKTLRALITRNGGEEVRLTGLED
jgi:hypothetical protein